MDSVPGSSSYIRHSAPFYVSGSTGTSTRNRINASLGKQHFSLAEASPSSSSSRALFDAVPRNAEFDSLKPILARLPLEFDDDDDDDDSEEAASELDYVVKSGTNVLYTRSRLPFLDSTSIDLWRALHHFRPLTADYASGYLDSAPHPLTTSSSLDSCPAFLSASTRALSHLRTSFNWSLLPALPSSSKQSWYGVLFLSQRKLGSESSSFYEADRLAHEEATRSGGLIMYWYGAPNASTGANLATCIWTSRTAALQASKLPLHHKAARFAAPSYERYDLIRYKVVKYARESRVRIEAWTAEDDRVEQEEL
uniref:Uncharacterized protein n=2 Tax=Kalmanozyma brasiliensis (strain GHG001) TaxID=1365824 RepID=V5GSH7_KALBG